MTSSFVSSLRAKVATFFTTRDAFVKEGSGFELLKSVVREYLQLEDKETFRTKVGEDFWKLVVIRSIKFSFLYLLVDVAFFVGFGCIVYAVAYGIFEREFWLAVLGALLILARFPINRFTHQLEPRLVLHRMPPEKRVFGQLFFDLYSTLSNGSAKSYSRETIDGQVGYFLVDTKFYSADHGWVNLLAPEAKQPWPKFGPRRHYSSNLMFDTRSFPELRPLPPSTERRKRFEETCFNPSQIVILPENQFVEFWRVLDKVAPDIRLTANRFSILDLDRELRSSYPVLSRRIEEIADRLKNIPSSVSHVRSIIEGVNKTFNRALKEVASKNLPDFID
jgi:hypothetical protein